MEDAGQSMSPYVDIGQLEGAFVMGLGYFTSEELIYDKGTGKLLTDRTWVSHNKMVKLWLENQLSYWYRTKFW